MHFSSPGVLCVEGACGDGTGLWNFDADCEDGTLPLQVRVRRTSWAAAPPRKHRYSTCNRHLVNHCAGLCRQCNDSVCSGRST
jgi:hypothetical protein